MRCQWPAQHRDEPGVAADLTGWTAIPISVGYIFLASGKGAQRLTAAVVLAAMLFSFGLPGVDATPVAVAEPYSYGRNNFVTPHDLKLALDETQGEFKRLLMAHQGILSNHSSAINLGGSRHNQLVMVTDAKLNNISKQFNRQLDDTASNMLRKVIAIAIE